MHQPLTVADVERVYLVNGEIIHLLRRLNNFDAVNLIRRTACFAYGIANFQVFGISPAFAFHVEGMFGRGGDIFAINIQMNDGLVGVANSISDTEETDCIGYRILCKNKITDLDFADCLFAAFRGDFGVRAEAIGTTLQRLVSLRRLSHRDVYTSRSCSVWVLFFPVRLCIRQMPANQVGQWH